MPGYADVVDLDRYPLHYPESEYGRALVARCREELADKGVCNLPGFITASAVDAMVALAAELAPKVWSSDQTHAIYFGPADSTVPAELAFFHGANALHKVSPVRGSTPRINSVLTYGERPDMRLNDLTSQLFYGRTS